MIYLRSRLSRDRESPFLSSSKEIQVQRGKIGGKNYVNKRKQEGGICLVAGKEEKKKRSMLQGKREKEGRREESDGYYLRSIKFPLRHFYS